MSSIVRASGFLLANVRGLVGPSQLSHLETLLSSQLDFLALTETHLDSSISDSFLCSSTDWSTFRRDRSRHGGGVALLARSSLHCKHRPDLQSSQGEDLWIETSFVAKKVLIGVFYRPPCQNAIELQRFLVDLESSLSAVSSSSLLILLGDFNAKHSDWLPGSITDFAGSSLLNLLESFGLEQLVSEVTRPPGGQGLPSASNSGSLLDLVITNDSSFFSDPVVDPPFGSSDHFSVLFELKVRSSRPQSPARRLWNVAKGNIPAFLYDLTQQHWPPVDSPVCLDDQWSAWLSTFTSCAARHIPSKLIRRPRAKPPWLSDVLLAECKLKRALFRLSKSSPSPTNLANYREQRNKVTALLRRAKKSFSSKLEQDLRCSSGRFWSFVSRCRGRKSSRPLPPLVRPDGSLASTDFDKAVVLNDFFVQQSQLLGRDDSTSAALAYSSPCSAQLSSVEVSPDDVFHLLSTLNVNKSPGLDDLPNNLLRAAAPAISPSLCVLFHNSLSAGKLPKQWKLGKIKAVFKRGRRNLPDNYRPISLLPTVCKVLESIINRQLYSHLDRCSLLSPLQSGFRRGDSPALQLFRLTESTMSAIDSGQVAATMFFDIRKAFDTVWHKALLDKLALAGVCGRLLEWFKDFLLSRQQCVAVGNALSPPASPMAGVPQGSVLSPTLFLLFINSITSVSSSPTNCFADDTSITVISPTVASAKSSLQLDVAAAALWAKDHKVSFHPAKSVSMLFHHPRHSSSPLNISLNGRPVSQVFHRKHLGVKLSSTFSWSAHVDSVISKVSSMLAILRLLRSDYRFSRSALLRVYLTCIRPVLEFGSVVWCGLSPSCSRRLEATQLKALAISGSPPSSLPSLASRRSAALARLFARILSGDVPEHLLGFCSWPSVSSICNKSLRSASSIRLPRPRTTLLLSSPLYVAASSYNDSL